MVWGSECTEHDLFYCEKLFRLNLNSTVRLLSVYERLCKFLVIFGTSASPQLAPKIFFFLFQPPLHLIYSSLCWHVWLEFISLHSTVISYLFNYLFLVAGLENLTNLEVLLLSEIRISGSASRLGNNCIYRKLFTY